MDQSRQTQSINPALSGVRVIEISQFDAGAACAEALAWFGADVVKIEKPGGVDGTRFATTEKAGVDSYDFIVLNANKRSVTCDLESETGKSNFSKLLTNADVLIENMPPGVMERLGFGYEILRELNPRIIYAKIRGFAPDGPRADYLCSDMIAQSVGGGLCSTGPEGGPPVSPGSTVGDIGAGLHCVMGILAALHQRHATGHGQAIEVSMQGALINLTRATYVDQLTRGKPLERMGNAARNATAPSNLFPCKPGGANDYVFIHINKTAVKHWQALLKVMGREDLMNDPMFSTPAARHKHRDAVNALVSAWCRERTKREAMEAIQNAGATAGAVFDMRDLTEDPHLRKRGMVVTLEHPVRGRVTMPGWPVKMSDSHVPVRSAPLLGAHTEEVLSEWSVPSKNEISAPHKNAPLAADRSPQHQDPKRALSGVRVVDLTQFEAGTSCTEALAWLGADVVKVEEPERGDRGRYGNTDQPGVDAYYFILLNANKRSLTCDLKLERGKALLRQLIKNADILVENMAPGVIERLGFGYDVVSELNPRIIFAQIKGFASDGPYAKYLCFDGIAQTAGGSMSMTGVEGGPPLRPGPHLGDTGAGMHCVTGILAALCQREVTGRGQRVQMAMQESVINFSRMGFASYMASGKPPERHGNRSIYRCKGGGPNDYCVISISEDDDEQWRRLLLAIGKQGLINDSRFSSPEGRVEHTGEVDALLSTWCIEHTKIEAMDILQRAAVPSGAALDAQDLSNDPHLRKSGIFATIEHPVRGPVTIPAWPVSMSDSHVPIRCAPLLGAHTAEVLTEWLGMSNKEIQEFSQDESVQSEGTPATSQS